MPESDQKSSWKTGVIIPSIAVIALGVATALSDGFRKEIGLWFNKRTDPTKIDSPKTSVGSNPTLQKKIPVLLTLTNNKIPLKGDTAVFDNQDTLVTGSDGICFLDVTAGGHHLQVRAYKQVFTYVFYVPNKPDSVYNITKDINYNSAIPTTTSALSPHSSVTSLHVVNLTRARLNSIINSSNNAANEILKRLKIVCTIKDDRINNNGFIYHYMVQGTRGDIDQIKQVNYRRNQEPYQEFKNHTFKSSTDEIANFSIDSEQLGRLPYIIVQIVLQNGIRSDTVQVNNIEYLK